jgi:BatD DUF11 like domain
MKKTIFSLAILLFSLAMSAQDAKFSIKVSKTTVSLNSKFKVEFILENANGVNFQAPNFEDFTIVSGPNTSSMMSMTNGEVKQSMTYSYQLKPKKKGEFVVPAVSIKTKGETLKTEKVKIKVTEASEDEDEDTAIEDNERPSNPQSMFGRDLFQDFFRQRIPQPQETPKKKRKSYSL